MKGFDDPYKSEGIVQLKIEKLSQFAQGGPLNSFRYSEVIYVRGLEWKILAKNLENDDKQVDLKQRVLGYYLECNPKKNAGLAWSCTCSASLKVLAQKDGKEDYVQEFSKEFNANQKSWGFILYMTFDALMNPELGWYDEATDSVTLYIHIVAGALHGVKKMPNDAYKTYTMRSEHSLFVELKDGSNCPTSSLSIEDKLCSFKYSPDQKVLELEMSMHQSDNSKTIAECIFWFWHDKNIGILEKSIQTFSDSMVDVFDSGMKSSKIVVHTNGATPANKKFNIVIRLLDERIASENSLESYFGKCRGIDTVTLSIPGTNKASFVVPKYILMQGSPVFERMFDNEMTEKASGKVEIEDTNPEEFCEFLKAISPKQELPNPSNVFALVKLAHLYQFQSLLDRCERHLMNCVEIPLIHLFTCANFYGLKKLKNHLMVSLDGTGLSKLLQQTEPYLGILNEITKKIE